ncbi:hypothetical protein GCM10027290_15460 [Micromonospora sonneratiae]|jgi:formate hydrogenlyase regulatory protein HycA|uniref:Formate hydrogenlyase regulatory protein HycA n=1 Tax=Micromonospora sonneratiae TaxID=1184706 RepID=A0ABW3YDS0_9ACTN
MAVPDLIPIMHEPGYHTDQIGRYADGQFFGCVTAAFREGVGGGDDWPEHKRWYAVLHRFDHDGHYRGSEIWYAGTTAQGERDVVDRAEQKLATWLAELPQPTFGDIAVRLFSVEVDGIVFGLVDESDDEYGEHVELYPNELGFNPPWDGEYDT